MINIPTPTELKNKFKRITKADIMVAGIAVSIIVAILATIQIGKILGC